LILLWCIVSPPVPTLVSSSSFTYTAILTCRSSNLSFHTLFTVSILTYNGILLLIGLFLSLATRKVQTGYRESRLMGMSIWVVFMTAAIVGAVEIGLGGDVGGWWGSGGEDILVEGLGVWFASKFEHVDFFLFIIYIYIYICVLVFIFFSFFHFLPFFILSCCKRSYSSL